jgi:hypothetical protein
MVPVKGKVDISQNFVAFLEYMNFSRSFLVRQLFFLRFSSIIQQLICCCFMIFQINQLYWHFYIVLSLIKRKNLVEKIKTTINCQTIDSKPSKKNID